MPMNSVKTYLKAPLYCAWETTVPQRGKYRGPVDDKAIGKKLREIRIASGKSQTDLARELGINQSLISEYEQGSIRLQAPVLAGLAKALKASADEILGLKKSPAKGGALNRRFTRRLRKIELLPPAQQQAVLKLLDGVLESRTTRH